MIQTEVLSNNEVAEGYFLLKFKRTFDFEPGQVIAITTEKSNAPRLYSICSSRFSETIDVLYGLVESGQLTPCMSKLKIGQDLWIGMPSGKFTSRTGKNYWIATGTGLAPFASMAFSGDIKNKILIHGVAYENQLFFRNKLTELLEKNYIGCCSKEECPGLFFGRVTHYLSTIEVLPNNATYYLCGNAEMVVETRELLISKGVSFDRILAEIYF